MGGEHWTLGAVADPAIPAAGDSGDEDCDRPDVAGSVGISIEYRIADTGVLEVIAVHLDLVADTDASHCLGPGASAAIAALTSEMDGDT